MARYFSGGSHTVRRGWMRNAFPGGIPGTSKASADHSAPEGAFADLFLRRHDVRGDEDDQIGLDDLLAGILKQMTQQGDILQKRQSLVQRFGILGGQSSDDGRLAISDHHAGLCFLGIDDHAGSGIDRRQTR